MSRSRSITRSLALLTVLGALFSYGATSSIAASSVKSSGKTASQKKKSSTSSKKIVHAIKKSVTNRNVKVNFTLDRSASVTLQVIGPKNKKVKQVKRSLKKGKRSLEAKGLPKGNYRLVLVSQVSKNRPTSNSAGKVSIGTQNSDTGSKGYGNGSGGQGSHGSNGLSNNNGSNRQGNSGLSGTQPNFGTLLRQQADEAARRLQAEEAARRQRENEAATLRANRIAQSRQIVAEIQGQHQQAIALRRGTLTTERYRNWARNQGYELGVYFFGPENMLRLEDNSELRDAQQLAWYAEHGPSTFPQRLAESNVSRQVAENLRRIDAQRADEFARAEARERREAQERQQREFDRIQREAEEARRQRVIDQQRRDDEDRRRREQAARAQREAAERQQREAAERQQREAAERQRREAEENLQRAREAAERQRREAEENRQQELARQQREAIERQQREAIERQQREAEENRQQQGDQAPSDETIRTAKEALATATNEFNEQMKLYSTMADDTQEYLDKLVNNHLDRVKQQLAHPDEEHPFFNNKADDLTLLKALLPHVADFLRGFVNHGLVNGGRQKDEFKFDQRLASPPNRFINGGVATPGEGVSPKETCYLSTKSTLVNRLKALSQQRGKQFDDLYAAVFDAEYEITVAEDDLHNITAKSKSKSGA